MVSSHDELRQVTPRTKPDIYTQMTDEQIQFRRTSSHFCIAGQVAGFPRESHKDNGTIAAAFGRSQKIL